LYAETRREGGKQNTTHGHTVGLAPSSEYLSWIEMRRRCSNPDRPEYPNYGGRGITVCERWNSYELFLLDMGPKPSPRHEIDRINNEGNYEPSNCRWALPQVQANNRRNNHRIMMAGETHTEAEWCRDLGVTPDVLFNHLNWNPELLSRWVRLRRERQAA
jgi:hypothetical protein